MPNQNNTFFNIGFKNINVNFSVKKNILILMENFSKVIEMLNSLKEYVDNIQLNVGNIRDEFSIDLSLLNTNYQTIVNNKLQGKIDNGIVTLKFQNFKDLKGAIIQFTDENEHFSPLFIDYLIKKSLPSQEKYDILEFSLDISQISNIYLSIY